MFKIKKSETDPTYLQIAIERLFEQLDATDQTSKEYDALTTQLRKLITLQKETETKSRVSPDAWVAAGASLLGILAIIGHEHIGPITSKAVGFVIRPKV